MPAHRRDVPRARGERRRLRTAADARAGRPTATAASPLLVRLPDERDLLPQSDMENTLVGLNLLRLLVQNRIAEFHTELEVIPPAAQESVYVKQSIMLEQWLMEGAYNKVMNARTSAPGIDYAQHFLDALTDTVKEELAACSSRAYDSLSLADAKKIMRLDSDRELLDLSDEQVRAIRSVRRARLRSRDAPAADARPPLPRACRAGASTAAGCTSARRRRRRGRRPRCRSCRTRSDTRGSSTALCSSMFESSGWLVPTHEEKPRLAAGSR